jgi:hypothetical protein
MKALHSLMAGAALVATSTLASAQSFQFQINPALSNYTWSGTTSLGTMQGNPSNAFSLSGPIEINLQSGGNPVGGGQWLSSNAMVMPDLSAIIPNALIFLPPLAVIDITNLSFTMSSTPFTCDAMGAFATTSTLTMLTGTLTVTPLVGAQTVTNLAGTPGPPSATTGLITAAGGVINLNSPMNAAFQFVDPSSGITANMTLLGTLAANYTCPAVTSYCSTTPNSAGAGAITTTTGSTSISANDLVLRSDFAPVNKPGIFYYGPNQISAPFGNGLRCVGGGSLGVRRLPPTNSGAAGVFVTAFNHATAPGTIFAGQTWNFQCWYRDPAAGGANFNLSDAVSVTFCP